MEFKPGLAETVERMRRLWNWEDPLDRIPAMVTVPGPPAPGSGDGIFFGKLPEYLAHQEATFRVQAAVADDAIPMVHPQYGHALIAGLCGSPIRALSDSVWSVPVLQTLDAVGQLRLDWDSALGVRVREEYDYLLDWARGRCAVAEYEVEGISDTMVALRGAAAFCLDLLAEPAAAGRFADRVCELLIEFGRWNNRQVGARQELLGGMTSGWRLWMPAGSIVTTEDSSVLLSPDTYRQFVAPRDQRLAAAFATTLLEVHAESHHQLREFGAVPAVSLLVISNPLHLPTAHREAVRGLIGRKILWISCSPMEVESLLDFTGVRGVVVRTSAEDPGQAARVLDDLKRTTARRGRRSTFPPG